MGNFISDSWKKITGQNQQIDEGLIGSEYDTAQGTWNAETGTGTGAMGTYGQLQQTGFDMMNADSSRNLSAKARMDSTGADAAAESSRLAGRNAAMAGGAPAGALAAQTQAGANTAQAGANDSFNQYLTGQFGQGAGMVSGAANNMASMGMNKMNAMSNQRQANNVIDSQATAFGANMLGKGLGMFNPAGMGVTMAGKLAAYGKQDGGYIGYQRGGMPLGGLRPGEMRARHEQIMREQIAQQRDPQNNVPMQEPEYQWDNDAPGTSPAVAAQHENGGVQPQEEQSYQTGGDVTRNSGGMLSQIMGPDGIPMHIRTRIGGQTVGQ